MANNFSANQMAAESTLKIIPIELFNMGMSFLHHFCKYLMQYQASFYDRLAWIVQRSDEQFWSYIQ